MAYAVGKATGNAVVRNRLRRRLREAVRQSPGLPPGTYLVKTRPQAAELSFPELIAHLTSVANQARRYHERGEQGTPTMRTNTTGRTQHEAMAVRQQ